MPDGQPQTLLRQLRRLIPPPGAGGVADAELIDRFVREQDEAAFELLVWRHGPMVLGVCTRAARDAHDAEDAFQATFLTLARKAGSIGKRASIASWLYKVAYRITLRARARAAKRAARERPLGDLEMSAPPAGDEPAWRELRPVLDAEVQRLPEKYRTAFVLCHLEGKTNEEAAQQLGCPRGTILSRLARARAQLRTRLARRGLALAPGALLPLLTGHARAAAPVPLALVNSAVQTAAGVWDKAAAPVAASVAELTEATMSKFFSIKLGGKTVLAALVVSAGLATGVVAYVTQPGERPNPFASGDSAGLPDGPCSSCLHLAALPGDPKAGAASKGKFTHPLMGRTASLP